MARDGREPVGLCLTIVQATGSRTNRPRRSRVRSLLIEHVLVLGVAKHELPIGTAADDELDPRYPRPDRYEGHRAIRVLARGDFALPFTEVEHRGPVRPGHRDLAEGRVRVAGREPLRVG